MEYHTDVLRQFPYGKLHHPMVMLLRCPYSPVPQEIEISTWLLFSLGRSSCNVSDIRERLTVCPTTCERTLREWRVTSTLPLDEFPLIHRQFRNLPYMG